MTCGAGFLAGVHAGTDESLRLPVVGDVRRFRRSARLGIAVGMGLLAALLLTGVLGVAGAVL